MLDKRRPTPADYMADFSIVRRGYDPEQVEHQFSSLIMALDAAEVQVGELRSLREENRQLRRALAEAEQRNEEILTELESKEAPSFDSLGPRIVGMLKEAERDAAERRAVAEQVLAEAHDEADQLLHDAEMAAAAREKSSSDAAEALRADAEAETTALLDAAREEARLIVDSARSEASRLTGQSQTRIDAMAETHALLRSELNRLYTILGQSLLEDILNQSEPDEDELLGGHGALTEKIRGAEQRVPARPAKLAS